MGISLSTVLVLRNSETCCRVHEVCFRDHCANAAQKTNFPLLHACVVRYLTSGVQEEKGNVSRRSVSVAGTALNFGRSLHLRLLRCVAGVFQLFMLLARGSW